MEQVRLLGTTAVLTVLIWASADSLVNETAWVGVTFDLVPAPGTSNMILDRVAPSDPFELQISGPRRMVDSVLRQAPFSVRFPVVDHPNIGPNRIWLDRTGLKRILAEQFDDFRRLTITSVRPDTLPISVDRWVDSDVELVMNRLTLPYEIEPQLNRTASTVRVRESRLREFPSGQPLQLDISADVERTLNEQPPGRRSTVTVTLDNRLFGPSARLTPSTVEATATVRLQRRTVQIPTVPVLIAVSFANLEKAYRIVTPDGDPLTLVTQSIVVTGPTEEVNRLERGATRAFGIIHLKESDLEQLDLVMPRTAEYHLPKGVELAEEPPPLQFKLINITDTTGK